MSDEPNAGDPFATIGAQRLLGHLGHSLTVEVGSSKAGPEQTVDGVRLVCVQCSTDLAALPIVGGLTATEVDRVVSAVRDDLSGLVGTLDQIKEWVLRADRDLDHAEHRLATEGVPEDDPLRVRMRDLLQATGRRPL